MIMESLQLAQMLADLSDLNAAQEAKAALAVVEANNTLPPAPTSNPSSDHQARSTNKSPEHQQQRHHTRAGSASELAARTVTPAQFDKFGRRILTPPLTRTNSNQGTPGTATPVRGFDVDDDVTRATSLMQLYDIRAKLKQQDNSAALAKARERISALHARQQQQQSHSPSLGGGLTTPDVPSSRFAFPKSAG